MSGAPWARSIVTVSRNADAVARLFCFPFAGGGASVFRKWAPHIASDIELLAIQLPGRESRIAETPLTSLRSICSLLAADIAPLLDRPYAFYGHSLGSLVAFSLARELRSIGAPLPMHLFLSGRRAPHLPSGRRPLYGLPRQELLVELERLEGTPRAVLENEELLELFLPLLRADFQVNETYEHATLPPLPFGASVMGGLADEAADRGQLEAWQEHFEGKINVSMFPGGHFYIDDALPVVGGRVSASMAQLLRSGAAQLA